MHFLVKALTVGAISLGLASCASNPVTGRPDLVFQSEKGEIERAKQVHPMLLQQFGGIYADVQLQQYVNEVGQRAAKASHRPDLQYTFVVLDSEDINAFTPGGGFVYITRGIMSYLNSEAELAAVLGHEIGHVTARHPVRQQSQSTLANIGAAAVGIFTGSGDLAGLANYAGAALVSGYGRDQELEADRLGAEYLARIGHDPDHMIDVVRLLKNQELFEVQRAREEKRQPRIYHGVFSTHPDNDQRLREVVKAAEKFQQEQAGDPGRERYLKAITGLPFGTSRAQGVLKGNRFYHADLGLTVAFPSGWAVENHADRLVAVSPQQDSFLQMQTQAPPPNTGPREFLSRMLARSSASQVEALEINGLQAYTAVVRSMPTPRFGAVPARIVVIYYNNLAYIFAGASKASSGVPSADALFMSSIKTFRRLRQNEFALAEPYKIKVIQANENTRIADLAKVSPLKEYPVELLRLLNDLYPNKEPQPGQLLKIIE